MRARVRELRYGVEYRGALCVPDNIDIEQYSDRVVKVIGMQGSWVSVENDAGQRRRIAKAWVTLIPEAPVSLPILTEVLCDS